MYITPQRILVANDRVNQQVHDLRATLIGQIASTHAHLCQKPKPASHLSRVGDACTRNLVWGFKLGAQSGHPVTLLLGPPRLAFGAHNLRLGIGLPWRLGIAGVAYLGYFAVGEHRAETSTRLTAPLTSDMLQADGWIGTPIIRALVQRANAARQSQHTQLAQACMWGAAVVSVGATVLRLGVAALQALMAWGVGCWAALWCGALAAAMQMGRSEDEPVVDFGGPYLRNRPSGGTPQP